MESGAGWEKVPFHTQTVLRGTGSRSIELLVARACGAGSELQRRDVSCGLDVNG